MSKRAVSFAEKLDVRTFKRSRVEGDDGEELDIDYDLPDSGKDENPFKDDANTEYEKKHTLDSDEEEDDDKKPKRLDMRKVEGQEETNLEFDGNIKITAFNMKEEEEDGHFDADGNFVFEKKKDIKDAWLDDIDWAAVKSKAGDKWKEGEAEEAEDAPPPVLSDARRREIFTELMPMLIPGETIMKALSNQQKKKKGLTAAEERKLRWAAKKAGQALSETDDQKHTRRLGELADELLSGGHSDAYEWTFEKVQFLLKRLDTVASDELDMFSDAPATASTAPATSSAADSSTDDGVRWEYKENVDADIQGPFSSEHMSNKQDAGELAKGGFARRVGTGEFHSTDRIDFSLYC